MKTKLTRVCVYGSLLSELSNHHRLQKNKYKTDTTINFIRDEIVSIPFCMISKGVFPALIHSENEHDIVFEIYDVDETVLRSLDQLEGFNRKSPEHSMYRIETTKLSDDTDGVFYYMNEYETEATVIVEKGDWKSYVINQETNRLTTQLNKIQDDIDGITEYLNEHKLKINSLKTNA